VQNVARLGTQRSHKKQKKTKKQQQKTAVSNFTFYPLVGRALLSETCTCLKL
jgi:hypothetical protein